MFPQDIIDVLFDCKWGDRKRCTDYTFGGFSGMIWEYFRTEIANTGENDLEHTVGRMV